MKTIFQFEKELKDFDFSLDCYAFRDTGEIRFNSPQESRDFLIKYLLRECISGVNYCDNEFWNTYSKVDKLVRNGIKFYYSDLPIHPQKEQKKQPQEIIYYLLQENFCYTTPKNPAT